MRLQRFKVTGNGTFPVDMLRRDGCFPETTEDAVGLLWNPREDGFEIRTITLLRHTNTKTDLPTIDRWESFGWKVSDIKDLGKK